ncbi:MAG: AAA family ATPase [Paludibacteraceae bacterium]|nr:AAA family ATPase [Paludibacteraceae bacterium]
MRQETINQLSQAAIAGDTFAMTYLGVIAYEGKYVQRDIQTALQYLQRASQNGVIWARDLLLFAMRVNPSETNISEHALITTGATQQLEQYAQQGNYWAATAIGELYMRGVTTFQNISAASQYLQTAANTGCLLAQDLLREMSTPSPAPSVQSNTNWQTPSVTESHDYIRELQDLIGLTRVKGEVESLRNFVLVQKQREANGLKPASVSYHCVFSGSPGTGKTTVARIVAGIYKEMGILKKGHLVEVQRADLVGEYMGQTAPKTNAKIDEALDGVLFIDEAYSLADGSRDDQYGREAVDTILKRMEDDRDRLVVILAGYSEPIKGFIHSNPGLESRFNRYIHFDDYTADELLKIFAFNLEKAQYTITRDAYQKVYEVICNAVAQKDERFGNARYVRNLFERIIQRQADRLAHLHTPSREELGKIEKEDINE